MSIKQYDVIIVGAGPAGLMLAKFLNNTEHNVLLMEKRGTTRELANHRYGTFKRIIEEYNLGAYEITNYKKFSFVYLDEAKTSFVFPDGLSVIDMNLFAKDLKLKCDIQVNTQVTSIYRKDELIELKTAETLYQTKIIVDCSGEAKVVAKALGYNAKKPIDFYSTSLELTNCDITQVDEMKFMGDLEHSNSAFWFYPYSKTEAQIGQTEWFDSYPDKEKQLQKLKDFISSTEPYKTWLKDAKIEEKVFGIGPASTLNDKIVANNFISCGNAAGAGTPFIGEGFRVSLDMAKYAHETIIQAFATQDFSEKSLHPFKDKFDKEYGEYYIWSTILRTMTLKVISKTNYITIIKNIRKLDDKEAFEFFASKITPKMFIKVLDPKLAISIMKDIIRYYLFGKKVQ